ncbi:antirestriction protein ArdC [Rhizobium rhizosphaerae]|uniref:Antirestriction protein ArdC n=1 Tax=Xaviernesmea rhizosphaerae TaxID=1672749 RepID=A0A1Q9AHH1_9HYPH|nr:zincin-like metallopeptidase domain-containing protein [Xaviernesmea rhizosphaerae]OLP54634.1 antirestriction protein ArdC [Xaviernesmea rhizosphaerae]
MKRKSQGACLDVYSRITEKIVADLERGVRPWMRPWHCGHAAGRVARPLRHNGLPYSGMNVLLLWSEAVARGFAAPIWMTFKQAVELGGAVRRGEAGTTVVFASRFTKTEKDAHGGDVERDFPFLKTYTAFNVEQIDGLPERYYGPAAPVQNPAERIEHADRFFANTGAMIRHGGDKAFFSSAGDFIQMPAFQMFRDAASYYATLSHESCHWAGGPNRLNRDLSRYHKDRSERAREELIAELGSCFLCADLGIAPELEPRPDHASYLASWVKVLSDDRRAIFQAAAHAQSAVSYLHNLQPAPAGEREAA